MTKTIYRSAPGEPVLREPDADEERIGTVASRLRILGIVMVLSGIFGLGVAGYTLLRTSEGITALQTYSAAQGVELAYNENGEVLDRGTPEGGAKIMALVTDDWGYAISAAEMDPNDPLVNTASEYMYQMGTISYHTLFGETTVVLAEEVVFEGETFAAGEYTFVNDGKYWADFNRAHPIEGPARAQLWTGTAHALNANLGVGAVTASTLTIGLGLVGVIGGLAGTLLLLGLGLVWVAAAVKVPETVTAKVPATNPASA
jgi:hypothetical protein